MSLKSLEIIDTGAGFSPCMRYRYTLWRQWGAGPQVAFIGLNPSTADATNNDPTITRCIDFAFRWGYGKLWMLNIFAFRATDPYIMVQQTDPVGPENDATIVRVLSQCKIVVATWGVHGRHLGRAKAVIKLTRADEPYPVRLWCLGKTKGGDPKHPLYLRKSSALQAYP